MNPQKEKVIALHKSAPPDKSKSLSLNTNNILYDNSQSINSKSSPGKLNTVSLTELYDTAYTPKTQIIEGLLYSGVYLFAGAPKVGKSFFMAQLGFHVSVGLPLWEYKVNMGPVLYLALEDDFARLQKRLSRMFGMESDNKFFFATEAKRLIDGLDGQLDTFLKEQAETKLIIIDTLQKVRELSGDRYSYSND